MSLLPHVLDCLERPSRILDQHFGIPLTADDLLEPITLPHYSTARYCLRNPSRSYYRPWRSTSSKTDEGSTIQVSKGKFQVNLDVQQFEPEDLTVSIEGKMIKVEGKHEEKADQHGFISRHFVRKYTVPEGTDIDNVTPTLSSDGVLTITAPLIKDDGILFRNIPITKTDVSSKVAQKKEQDSVSNGVKK